MNSKSALKILALAVFTLCLGRFALGADMTLPQLSQDDVDAVQRDLSANTTLHNVMPPSSMGSIFGFEIGVVGGVTKAPGIDKLVKTAQPTANVPAIPHAGLVAVVSVPGGLTVEGMLLPKTTMSELSYQQYALGLKWTMTDGSIFPICLAVKGFHAKSQLSFSQTLTVGPSSATITVNNENIVNGVQLLASPKLIPIIEPYVGIGYLSGKGTLSSNAPAAIPLFADGSESKTTTPTSSQFLLGLDIRLFLIGLGVEYSKSFGTDSYTGKFSLKF